MLFVGTSIIHPSTEGVFLLCNILDLLIYSTEDIPPAEVGNLLIEKSIDRQEERIDQRDLAGKILSEVREVNAQWYDVLVLHCVEELPHAEAARRLQISETVFRARLCRARAYIRENFGEEYKKL